jgi:hypothetical protein
VQGYNAQAATTERQRDPEGTHKDGGASGDELGECVVARAAETAGFRPDASLRAAWSETTGSTREGRAARFRGTARDSAPFTRKQKPPRRDSFGRS